MTADRNLPVEVARRFQLLGDVLSAEPYGTGHINHTYAVTCDQAGEPVRYLLQRLNTNVFKTPRGLMNNIQEVTGHIRAKLEARGLPFTRRVLTLLPVRETGAFFLDDPDLGFWRCYLFIEGARTYDVVERTEQAFEAAKAFGAFQSLLADYQGPELQETIPDFHHTPRRLEALKAAVAQDPLGRAKDCEVDILFALEREPLAHRLVDLQTQGAIPTRITHNDTKLNNVMLDDATGTGVCVIDLDTVMPGLSLCDFGDMVRTACNPLAEDDADTRKMVARGDMFEALACGYLQGTEGALLPVERENLVVAGELLTYECGIRFLTDFLLGDTYFRTHRPGQNLDRARNQFALVRSLEQQENTFMDRIRNLV
ncbi:phosphotransferase enzyme family protein [Geothrix sp. PMB-07]|uniref:phosphotransferase enzyme family protein n=1 Tax=Geothrix sp. PMB-07 TaxID=3068640 RepID=UPI002741BBB0|nr:aminoglycoside phosphotransferase family protein [Geothrix sp. PMB-07]WLT30673.1 aminoglycoside phosphotransferase family protein [Geothrix sp. PMB-07]